jgi:LysM repeat protein
MSLINDALKRAQQAQPKRGPAQDPDRALQPALISTPKAPLVRPALVALACLALGLWIGSSWWRSAVEAKRMARASKPPLRAAVTTSKPPLRVSVIATAPVVVPSTEVSNRSQTGAVVAADAFIPASVQEFSAQLPKAKATRVTLVKVPSVPEGKSGPSVGGASEFDVYIVRAGDTLTRIAKRHATTVKALRDVNDFKADRIVVGQKIRVPIPPAPRATVES